MNVAPYRLTLALPGVRSLLLVALLARIPLTATAVTLTLHVVLDLDRGYAAAGLVAAAMTVGAATGAPLVGRVVDRRGLRLVVVATTVTEAVFWFTAPVMPYPVLVMAAFLGGLLALPVFSVIRQSLAALVPVEGRRQAYALDSMSVEVSFMVGPALAVLLATGVSARVAMLAVGAGIVGSGIALFLLNPPVRQVGEVPGGGAQIPRRQWLTGRLAGVLVISAAGTLVLGGTDVAVVAVLRQAEQVGWTGAVLAAWAVFSLLGGFAYGAMRRSLSPYLLAVLLCAFTVPVGLGGGEWWLLCIALIPAGALCAPSMAATADAVSRLAPVDVRGEAMGLHNSAITVGIALGAPLAGSVIDASAPVWGFAATGLVGLLTVLAVLPAELRRSRVPDATLEQVEPASPAGTAVASANPTAAR